MIGVNLVAFLNPVGAKKGWKCRKSHTNSRCSESSILWYWLIQWQLKKIPLCRHWKLAVLGRWPLLRGGCLWRFHFNHEKAVEWKLYRGVPCLWFLQFLGPLRWNISRSDQHASCMNLNKWSPFNNSNLSTTSSFQCLHSGHLPTTATFMLWVAI